MNPAAATHPGPAERRLLEPPGGVLVWLLVFVELVTFGAGLAVFAVLRRQEPSVFLQGQALLNPSLAAANTLVLLSGGWIMAEAIAALRAGDVRAGTRGTAWAAVSGLLFLVLKGYEFGDKLRHGLDLHHDTFFTVYWLLTGFHYLHVLVAVILLGAMWRGLRRGHYTPARHDDVESSGVFWHMCDLVWLLILPVVYLSH